MLKVADRRSSLDVDGGTDIIGERACAPVDECGDAAGTGISVLCSCRAVEEALVNVARIDNASDTASCG